MRTRFALIIFLALVGSANAYVGPGLGGGLVGGLLAVLMGIFMLLVGAVYYPIKKLLAHMRKKNDQPKSEPKRQ